MGPSLIVTRKGDQDYRKYRTKWVILEIHDKMDEAMKTGRPYETILDPTLGPSANGLPNWKPVQPKPKDWPPYIHAPKEVEE
jgi:hypothetical protein